MFGLLHFLDFLCICVGGHRHRKCSSVLGSERLVFSGVDRFLEYLDFCISALVLYVGGHSLHKTIFVPSSECFVFL